MKRAGSDRDPRLSEVKNRVLEFRLRWLARLRKGWTLIEMMLVMAIISTIVAIAMPNVFDALELARVTKAIGDINAIEVDLAAAEVDSLPLTLAEIGRDQLLDPWGNPYRYLNFAASSKGKGAPKGARKDRFLVPLNTSYDLYSMGADGQTKAPLSAKVSLDDVIRANDGSFIGLASKY